MAAINLYPSGTGSIQDLAGLLCLSQNRVVGQFNLIQRVSTRSVGMNLTRRFNAGVRMGGSDRRVATAE